MIDYAELEALLQGQWLHFYFVRDGEVWAGQLDVEGNKID